MQAGPSKGPVQEPSPANGTSAVKVAQFTKNAPARPSPLGQSTALAGNGAHAPAQAFPRSPTDMAPGDLAQDVKGKGKATVECVAGLGEPEASSTQQYFGADDDEAAFANFDIGVEEGSMEEESAFLAVDEEGMEVDGQSEDRRKSAEVTPPPAPPAAGGKPASSGGKSGGSTKAANSRLEMMRQAIAESKAAEGTGSAGNGAGGGGSVRVHSVGGFHFPDGMVSHFLASSATVH